MKHDDVEAKLTPLQDAMRTAHDEMLRAHSEELVDRLSFIDAVCAGRPDTAAMLSGSFAATAKAMALDRPHDLEHKRMCIEVDGVPLCFFCVLTYSARGEGVVTLPSGHTVERRHLTQAMTRYVRALAEMAGEKPDA